MHWAPAQDKATSGLTALHPNGDTTDQDSKEDTEMLYNISNTMLTPKQMTILQKGLSFSPTSRCNTFELHIDLQRFYHNLLRNRDG